MPVAEKYLTTIAKLKEDLAYCERELAAIHADRNDRTVQWCNTPPSGYLVSLLEERRSARIASLRRFGAYDD
jgi:hypothetical protein